MAYIVQNLVNPDGSIADNQNISGLAVWSNTPLLANQSFTTGWISYDQYQSATTVIFSDKASAVGGLTYEYSVDDGTTIINSVSGSFNTINDFRFASYPLGKGNSFRITYTNGAIDQTTFYFGLQLHLETRDSSGSILTPINIANIAGITKTFLQLPDVNSSSAVFDFITRTGNSLNVNVTNASTGLTDTQLRATPIPVSVSGGGDATAANQTLEIAAINTLLKPSNTLNKVSTVDTITNVVHIDDNGSSITVDGSVTVSGNVTTGGLTDAQIRATPLPISGTVTANTGLTQPLTDSQLRASVVPVSLTSTTITGTVATSSASLPLPNGASTSTLQTTGNTSLSSIDSKTPSLGQALAAASIPVVLTASQLTTLTPLSSISVSNFPSTQAVTGTFFQATQPVSIAASVAVTGPLTDTQIRATPLPISGTISNTSFIATQATAANLNATIVGTGTFATQVTSLPALPTGTNTIGAISNTTFTVNAGTNLNTSALALDATLTGGTQKAIARTAAKGTTIAADLTSTPVDVNTQALDVSVKGTVSTTLSGTPSVSISNFPVTQPVSLATIPLPSGASTETTLSSLNTKVPSGLVVTSGRLQVELPLGSGGLTNTELRASALSTTVTNFPATQAISASTLPLPTNAATSALQTTGNTSLSNIDTKVPSGLVVTSGRLQVELPSGGSGLTNTELRASAVPVSATTLPLPTGASTETTLSSINTKIPALGQNTMVNSTPVVLASNQTEIAVITNNIPVSTIADTGVKTATFNGVTQTNLNAKGVVVTLVISAVSGTTPTLTARLQGSIDGGTNWYNIPAATTASLVAAGNWSITVYPALTVLAGTTVTGTTAVASNILPRTWRMVYTITGTTPSFTITNVNINYLL